MKSTLNKFTLIFVTTCSTIIVHSAAYAGWGQTHGPINGTIPAITAIGTNIYAGTDSGIYYSNNNGSSWSNVGLNGDTILALAVYGTSIYAATFDSGIFISTNNGISWNTMNTGLPSSSITSLVLMGSTLFAGTDSGIFLYSNNGSSWNNSGLPGDTVNALIVAGVDIYAGTSNSGVYLSTDNGTSWSSVNNGLTNSTITAFGLSGGTIFAGTNDGIFQSSNSGISWSPVNSGLPNAMVTSFAIWGANVFAGTDSGVYLWNNSTSWIAIDTGMTDTDIVSLTVSGAYLFAGTVQNPGIPSAGVWSIALFGLPTQYAIDSISIDSITFWAVNLSISDTIMMSNTGNATLMINSISSDNAEITVNAPDTLPAGETATIVITLNDRSQYTGEATLLFSTNDIMNPVDTVTVAILAPVANFSSDSINLNVFSNSVTYSDTITVSNTGNETLFIDGVQSSVPTITASYPDSIGAGNSGAIIVSVNDSEQQYGVANLVVSTNDPWAQEEMITVTVNAPSALYSAESIIVATPAHPKVLVDTIALANIGNAPLVISGILSTNTLISAISPDTIAAGNTGDIIISLNDSLLENGVDYIVVSTNNPSNPKDTITVVIRAPIEVVSVDSLVVPVNSGVIADTITIGNSGGAALYLNGIQSTNTAILAFGPDSIAPGDTGLVVVLFNDSILQNGYAFLVISTNNPSKPTDTIMIMINAPMAVVPIDSLVFTPNPTVVTDTITISNVGNATLIIDSIESTDSLITTSSVDSLSAGDSVQIIITVSDSSQSSGTAYIVITTNNPVKPVDTITVIIQGTLSVTQPVMPRSLGLVRNYPNPFNTTTEISFSLQRAQHVMLQVFDALGSKVADLAQGTMDAGAHIVTFDATKLPEGVYYYRLTADGGIQTKPMTVVK